MELPMGSAGANVGLNILASPRRNNEDDEFISAAALADTENANDWDLSLLNSRGINPNVNRVASRWDRESLYQNFDPCARERPINPTPGKVRSTGYSSLQQLRPPTPLVEEESLRDDFFLPGPPTDLGGVESEDVFTTESPPPGGNQVLVQLESPHGEDPHWTIQSPQVRSSGLIEEDENDVCSPASGCADFFTTAHDIVMVDNEDDVVVVVKEDEVETVTRAELTEALLQIEEYKAGMVTSDLEKRSLEEQLEQLARAFRTMQMTFTEVNGRYERTQKFLENSRRNEALLVARDAEMLEKLACADERLEEIKASVTTKLDLMFQNYEGKYQSQNAEAGKLRAQLRRAEMKNEGLENEVKQKSSEIKKLSALCDDLIRQNDKH